MQNKVLMILCDGMRPDAVVKCGHPFAKELMSTAKYNPCAQTVFPSWTLPCHFSLFTSRTPDEHGILGNTYVPGERKGLFEQLRDNGKSTSFFYSWGELKDLHKPYSLCYGKFVSEEYFPRRTVTEMLEEDCEKFINEQKPDFAFLYLETTDTIGHEIGWGTEEYYSAANHSFGLIEKIMANIPKDYSVIVLADHGGHDNTHGTADPIDMTIPLFIKTDHEIDEEKFTSANIIDVAPTICDIIGIPHSKEWKGKSLLK
ncbi:MAG: alkaline phosphatase family protein [Oscillospiraceae bacterium]|nr:alkaline phosphatase family protein [Oscillospiraceae bacterium]